MPPRTDRYIDYHKRRKMGVAYHGNWVGPGWSAGKFQPSTFDPKIPAMDEFDQTGKDHDFVYSYNGDLQKADYLFASRNIGKGLKRTAAGISVGAQGLARTFFPQKNINADPGFDSNGNSSTPSRPSGTLALLPTPPQTAPQMAKTTIQKTSKRKRSQRKRSVKRKRSKRDIFKHGTKGEYVSQFNSVGINTTYVGHATYFAQAIRFEIFKCLYKSIMLKLENPIMNWADKPGYYFIEIAFWGKKNRSAATGDAGAEPVQFASYYLDNDVSHQENAITMLNTIQTALDVRKGAPYYWSTDWMLTSIYILQNVPGTDPLVKTTVGTFNMIKSSFHLDIHAYMKLQNVTNYDSTDSITDLHSIPLKYKAYESNGNGLSSNRLDESETQFQCINTTAFGVKEPLLESSSQLDAFPNQGYFVKTKVHRQQIMQPGEIINSGLHSKHRLTGVFGIPELIFWDPTQNPDGLYHYYKQGKVRFFAAQKVIAQFQTGTPITTKMMGEVSHTIRCAFKSGSTNLVLPTFNKNIIGAV